MRSPDVTSVEQLEALLADGRISEEDYDTLRAAMERKEEPAGGPQTRSSGVTFRRSTRDRVIAGVCGGIAESRGVDPWLVRLIAVLLLLFSGGAAVVAYVVLIVALPASDAGKASRPEVSLWGFPWAFAGVVLLMWMANLVYSASILPQFYDFWDEAGAELPRLTAFVVTMYHSILGRSVLALLFQAGICTVLVVQYALFPKGSKNPVLLWLVLLFGTAAWGILAIVVLYMPFMRFGDIVR